MASAFSTLFRPEALDARAGIRKIGPRDCLAALREGLDDFIAMPTHPVFIGIFYALAEIALVGLTSFGNALHLVFPFAAGFRAAGAVLRRRPLRDEPGGAKPACPCRGGMRSRCSARRRCPRSSHCRQSSGCSPSSPPGSASPTCSTAGCAGPEAAAALSFISDVLTTGRGWTLIVVGGVVVCCSATLALYQHHLVSAAAGAGHAHRSRIVASLRTARDNPARNWLWGLIVATALVLGSIPLFPSWALASWCPVLGHATTFSTGGRSRATRRTRFRSKSRAPEVANSIRFVWIFVDALDFVRQGMARPRNHSTRPACRLRAQTRRNSRPQYTQI